MMQLVGIIVCVAAIGWLFYLDRDPGERTDAALWIPTIWMLINASRGVSTWIHPNAGVSLAQQYTDGSPLDATIFGVLIAAGAVVLNYRAARVRAFLQANGPLLIFIAYCALSVAWSDDPFIAFKRWTKSVGDLVMVMVVLTDPNPRLAVKRLFTRAGFVLLPMSVLFIECFPDLGSAFDPEEMRTMYFGVTTFKNLLGMIAMVVGLASLGRFLDAHEDRGRAWHRHLVAHGVLIATAVWLIVKANSMTSLSCFVLAAAVMLAVSRGWIRRRKARVYGVVGAALVFPLFALFMDSVGWLVHSLGRNATLTGRTSIWKAVLAMHTNPVIGTGFESFWLGNRLERVWNLSVHGIQEAHNGYLELYLNLGWIGVALLAWLIATAFRNATRVLDRDLEEGRLRMGFLAASLIYSMTEAGFRMMSPIWLAFLLAMAGAGAPVASMARSGVERSALWRAHAGKQVRILQ